MELIAKLGGVPNANETLVECDREPLVACIVTLYTLCAFELHDRVAFPFAVMLLGDIAPHVKPFGTVSAKRTVPENPFNPRMLMVEFAEVPTSRGGGGEVVRMKSLNLNTANAECMRGPLVPVTFRAYVPAVGELHETVVLPEPVRLFAARAPQSSPGGILSARATVPLKPLSPKTEMVAVADFVVYTPAGDVAVIAKSCCLKLKVAVVECASEAFAPVIARV